METSQFVVDVLDDGGLEPQGRGLRSAQKIRLLHATMRYHVGRQDDWNRAWGLPVNQEDLAGTLMSFSVVIPRGLGRLGVDLPTEDRDAFFHVWRVVGHVLGVDDQLNPPSFDDGAELFDAVLRRQQKSSDAGIALTKAVLDFIREVLPGLRRNRAHPDPAPDRRPGRRPRQGPTGRLHQDGAPGRVRAELRLREDRRYNAPCGEGCE